MGMLFQIFGKNYLATEFVILTLSNLEVYLKAAIHLSHNIHPKPRNLKKKKKRHVLEQEILLLTRPSCLRQKNAKKNVYLLLKGP